MPDSSTLPLAPSGRERFALEIFPLDQSPEEYAARKGHLWAGFSFDEYRYNNPTLHAWVQRFGDIFSDRHDAPSIATLRATLLSAEERACIEEGRRTDQPSGHYPSVSFTSFTQRPGGDAPSRYEIDSATRDREGADFFHVILEQRVADLTIRLGPKSTIELEWTDVEGDCALATFTKDGIPLTTSALLCGRNAAKDDSVLQAFEQIVADVHVMWHWPMNPPVPPIRERPAIITAILPPAIKNDPESIETIRLLGALETDLAAAYFEQRQAAPNHAAKESWWRRLFS